MAHTGILTDRDDRIESVPEDLAALTEQRQGPAILILSRECSVQYFNRAAWDLLLQIHGNAEDRVGLLPRVVVDLCHDLERLLDGDRAHTNHSPVELSRVAGGVLLRSLALIEGRTRAGADRFLIMLEPLIPRQRSSGLLKQRYGLTERECTVVEGISRGLTNKEIGNLLGIAESTVKAHITHIMQKTKTSTRTGILAHLCAPESQ
ncbi:helix-turn-helix transcriptional regulator [Candidatus Nitrospira bockiana]